MKKIASNYFLIRRQQSLISYVNSKYYSMRSLFYVVLFLFAGLSLCAQSDNILWSGVKLQKSLDDRWGLALQPFFRFNEDLGAYQNTSLDYSLRYNLSPKWHVQLLGRTWFVPNNPQRQFIWFDLEHKQRYSSVPLLWTNRARMHLALNIHDRQDNDFIRYLTQFRLLNKGKFHPILGFELWYQTEIIKELTRYRFEPGFRYDVSSKSNLLLLWRRENFVNIPTPRGDNLWVLVMTFDL